MTSDDKTVVTSTAAGAAASGEAAAPAPAAPPAASARMGAGAANWLRETGLRVGGLFVAIVIVMIIFTALTHGRFFSVGNLLGLLRYMSTLAIMGLGLTLVIVVGEIDLSFANLYGLTANVAAVTWLVWGWPLIAAVAAAFAVAIVVGFFNAFFTTVVKIPSFIATLGSSTLVFGLTLYLGNTQTFAPAYPPGGRQVGATELSVFTGLSNQELPFNFPMQGVWMIGIALLFAFLLGRSLFGFRLKAIGGNPQAAELARLRVRRYKFAAFIIASVMACLAALLDFAFIGSVGPNAGQSNLFPVFAAVIIGGASLSGGRGTVIGTLSGAFLLAILTNGFALLGAAAFANQIFLGVVTIAAVALDRFASSRR